MWPLSPPAETEKKERGRYDIIFKWHWAAALHSDQVSLCIYRAAGLQTLWLNGFQRHGSARPWLDERLHCLPRIDPPAALLLSALLCCIDVLSNDFRAQRMQMFLLMDACPHAGILKTPSRKSTRTYFARVQSARLSQAPNSVPRLVSPLIFLLLGGIVLPRSN